MQHKGFGRRLLSEAEKLATQNGCETIAVISGIGVTEYYKKFGYTLKETFMTKDIGFTVISSGETAVFNFHIMYLWYALLLTTTLYVLIFMTIFD